MFHIFLLKPASLDVSKGPTPILKEEMMKEEYEVKKIVNVIRKRNRLL
jgi:hypothetical protein